VFFAGQLIFAKARILQNVRKDIGGKAYIFFQNAREIPRVLNAGGCIDIAAHIFDFFSDLPRGAGMGAFEGHMFQQVGQAVFFFSFAARARLYPNAN
jgi:hypothetical protein